MLDLDGEQLGTHDLNVLKYVFYVVKYIQLNIFSSDCYKLLQKK